MDNIVVKKLWSDESFYEAEIAFLSKNINCKVTTYLIKEEITLLSSKILDCVNLLNNSFVWEIGERGSKHSPKIRIEVTDINKRGYVFLDICCDIISSIDSGNYYCKFPMMIELGLLGGFAEKILSLNTSDDGTTIYLWKKNKELYTEFY